MDSPNVSQVMFLDGLECPLIYGMSEMDTPYRSPPVFSADPSVVNIQLELARMEQQTKRKQYELYELELRQKESIQQKEIESRERIEIIIIIWDL